MTHLNTPNIKDSAWGKGELCCKASCFQWHSHFQILGLHLLLDSSPDRRHVCSATSLYILIQRLILWSESSDQQLDLWYANHPFGSYSTHTHTQRTSSLCAKKPVYSTSWSTYHTVSSAAQLWTHEYKFAYISCLYDIFGFYSSFKFQGFIVITV